MLEFQILFYNYNKIKLVHSLFKRIKNTLIIIKKYLNEI